MLSWTLRLPLGTCSLTGGQPLRHEGFLGRSTSLLHNKSNDQGPGLNALEELQNSAPGPGKGGQASKQGPIAIQDRSWCAETNTGERPETNKENEREEETAEKKPKSGDSKRLNRKKAERERYRIQRQRVRQ